MAPPHTTLRRSFSGDILRARPPKKELSPHLRTAILSAVENRVKPKVIQDTFRVSKSTYYDTIKRWNEHGKITSLPHERRLLRIVRQYPRIEYAKLKVEAIGMPNVSSRTLSRLLNKYGIKKWAAKLRPALSPLDARNRLRQSVLRQMFWAAIWLGGRSELIAMERVRGLRGYTSTSYTNTLEDGLLPWNELEEEDFDQEEEEYEPYQFMQDNAPIHKSRETTNWLNAHEIEVIDWPPYSPDINPIEHLWWLLKQKLVKLYPNLEGQGFRGVDRDHFTQCAQEAWRAIPQASIDKLIKSVPRRTRAVIQARGWQTKY
ncbi:hypothetical protein CC80DRAFT_567739 [Byssothecium circinans]|uniref:Tc1-like transposase DDE domain-containing protein n=1 Tax=Byssothecium circinans TaxID=147558 RepID=A0A6A5TR80_9PLEO|nr:hypothetical protein CC80DRAFT_567739 [Byssothecium circinans]